MIKAKDAPEFSRLLQALANAIVTAHIHYQLYKDLRQALSDYPSVAAQSRAFWQLTLNAHINTSMQILCRVYDQQAQALHLRSWLLTIREHLHLFDKEAFRQRLQENPFVESLAQLPRRPDPMVLEEDIRLCSPQDPQVKILIIHRHSHVAHTGATNILAARNLHDAHPLTFGDFEALLARAKTILNRYSRLWAANTYETQIIGHDDYQYVFKCVEEKLQRIEEANQKRRRARRSRRPSDSSSDGHGDGG